MDIDKGQRSLSDWREYALALKAAHESALDGWEVSVRELEAQAKLVAKLRESNELLSKTIHLLESIAALSPLRAPAKRGRGRPRKHGDMNLADWYERECLPKFKKQNPMSACGMQKVLTWHFQQVFREQGQNPYNAGSRVFQAKLKTMVNLISDQRHPIRSDQTS